MMRLVLLTLLWAVVAAPTSMPRRRSVVIQGFQFKPAVIHAAVGDTIVWDNRDIVPHTADAANRVWMSGNIPAKAKAVTVMQKKGEYEFICLYHSNMKGKLVVR
jgi:plastocyanin